MSRRSISKKVFQKLKHGSNLVCPECGGRVFILETKICLIDSLCSEENGDITISCCEVTDIVKNLSLDDVNEIRCADCNTKIPRKWLRKIPGDKVKYV